MRTARQFIIPAFFAALALVCSMTAYGAPQVAFSPISLDITPNGTFQTPPIIVQNATGITQVNLTITVPLGITISPALTGGSLAAVEPGANAGALFFSEWNASTRQITVTCSVDSGATLEVVNSIEFSTGSVVTSEQLQLSGSVTGGSGSATFTSLDLVPHDEVTINDGPSVTPATVASGGSTSCGVSATDSLSHGITYQWSDGGAGGSFSPNANTQNPTYTAAANTTGSDTSVTLSVMATCAQGKTDSGTTSLTVHSVADEVTIASGPSVNPTAVSSGGSTSCNASATDSLSHSITYQWSDGGAGGSFTPNASAQNPTYTAAANTTGSDTSVTLSVTATCAQGKTDSGTTSLTVHSVADEVTITSGPSVNPTAVSSGGSTSCSASATDSLSHSITYQWSDGGAGGSFSPSASAQNPTYTAAANTTGSDISVTLTVTATCSQGEYKSKTKTLIVHSVADAVTITNGPLLNPDSVGSGKSTSCSVAATDSLGHNMTYQWSDGGAGGSFSPSASAQNPTYTAAVNTSGATKTVTISCTATCSQNPTVSDSGSVSLGVLALEWKTVHVTSAPGSGVSIGFLPDHDAAKQSSPMQTTFTLSYQTNPPVTLTAPVQDGLAQPRWFDHWVLDGANQPSGDEYCELGFSMQAQDHEATVVYDKRVGDLDSDGDVDQADADIILQVLFGEVAQTPHMDVNQDKSVNLSDAQWILAHP